MSLSEGIARKTTASAMLTVVVLFSVGAGFYLAPSLEVVPTEDVEQLRIIGIGALLLLSTVGTAFLALKISSRDA